MILNAERRLAAVPETFERLIVQIDVGNFDIAGFQRIRVNGEPVILRGDLHPSSRVVQHRMVCAVMSELQLVRLRSQCQAQQLMTQTNAENGSLADQLANIVDLRSERLRVAGTIGKEDTPSGFKARTSSAEVIAGTTVTRQPE